MRIMILGNVGNNIATAYSWFVKTTYLGFTELGHKVKGIDWKTNNLDFIRKEVYKFQPRIIFTHLTFHGHKSINDCFRLFKQFKDNGIIMVHTLQDARKEPRGKMNISEAFNIAFTSQLENLGKFKDYWRVPTYFWPYSSLTLDKMPPVTEKYKFKHPLFTGSHLSHRDRSDFIRRLQNVMPLRIVGTKSPEDLRDATPYVSVSAKCILGLCTGYNIGGYIDVRPFQYLGCGAFMISRKFKWQERILPDDIHVLFHSYKDPMVVKDLWKEWKKKDTWPIRKKAFEFIQKYHSCKVRMENTLKVIKGQQNSVKALLAEL